MKRFLFLLLFCGLTTELFSFPEMIRHKYSSCLSCHISPSGGGVLTKYGRALSGELLSTWASKAFKEEQFAYNAVEIPEWLDFWGAYRGIRVSSENPKMNKYIFMQGDLETSIRINSLYFVGSLGYQEAKEYQVPANSFISRRHYVNYRPTDSLSFRLGSFFPNFGLMGADHTIAVRRDLGFDQANETYNFEFAYLKADWDLFLTAILAPRDFQKLPRKHGFAVRPSYTFKDTYKLGANLLYTRARNADILSYGLWGVLAFTKKLYLLAEMDWQKAYDHISGLNRRTRFGYVLYEKIAYELIQGLHLYGSYDHSYLDISNVNTGRRSYGLGIQFSPRPHYELNMSWMFQKNEALSPGYTNYAWFMFNFYL